MERIVISAIVLQCSLSGLCESVEIQRYEVPSEPCDMEIPYMVDRPEIIEVNVGRQLFIDDYLIDSSTLSRTVHKPVYYALNPVLEPDKEWEQTATGAKYAAPFSDGIWYDETSGMFKMWYMTGASQAGSVDPQGFCTAYAESADGKQWTKPMFTIVDGTNIIDTDQRDASTVWIDKFTDNPMQRYKMFLVSQRPEDKRWHMVLKYSPDGINWSRGVAQSGDVYDRSTAFYNPFRGVWATSLRHGTPVSGRSRAYAEHTNPETLVSMVHRIGGDADDQNVHFWFVPSDKEPRHPHFSDVQPGIYNFDVIPYESVMVGFYSVWEGPDNSECARLGIQKRNELLLGFSRDGYHFSRPDYEPFMGVNETEGAWNWGNMQSVCGSPIIVGDSLYFYSSGRRLNDVMWDSHTSTGLAMLRRDGFVSLDADRKGGELLTHPIVFDGSHLFVNADVSASKRSRLLVEVTDVDGQVIEGFSAADCIPISGVDSTHQRIEWKGKTLEQLAGTPVRLRFLLNDGSLYAFWVSPWESGESGGYTAGGGPGLHPSGIDLP